MSLSILNKRPVRDDTTMIFILGASGFIGGYLYDCFKKEGYDVLGTYATQQKNSLVHFDLVKDSLDKFPVKPRYALFCSVAYRFLDDSKRFWKQAYEIDVVGTKKVMDYCFANGIIPIHFSSDNVFDGIKGDYRESDPLNPVTCYGKLKAEVEHHMLQSGRPFIILRMGKVFGVQPGDGTIVTSFVDDLLAGKKMRCVTDQYFTPVYIEEVFSFVRLLIEEGRRGIFHLASLPALTRYDLAQAIITFFHLNPDLVIPCTFETIPHLDARPKRIDLNIEQYHEIMGVQDKGIEYYLENIKNNLIKKNLSSLPSQ